MLIWVYTIHIHIIINIDISLSLVLLLLLLSLLLLFYIHTWCSWLYLEISWDVGMMASANRGSHLPWPLRRTSCGSCPARRLCLALPVQYLGAMDGHRNGNLGKPREMSGSNKKFLFSKIMWDSLGYLYFEVFRKNESWQVKGICSPESVM